MKLFAMALLVAALAAAQAPTFDTSGNKLLSGSHYFRYVGYEVGDTAGDIDSAITLYGGITFDGNGNYTITGQELDTGNGVVQNASLTGTYTISASGYGYLSNPIATTGVSIYGLVSNGIFVGSSTEQTTFSDLFIAAPMASTATASSVFNGSYATAYFVPSGTIADSADAMFQLNPNGAGNLGTINLSGFVGQGGATVLTQSSANVKYVISNGAANIMFPDTSTANFIAGNEYAYITPDGNFIFGGSPANYDMFVGVKTGAGAGLGGLYYTAGLAENEASYPNGYADLNTYYGSFFAGDGLIVGHERFTSVLNNTRVFGVTYNDTYTVGSGTYTDTATSMQYTVGDGGLIRIGLGDGPLLGISVAIKAPAFSGSGVFLSPVGVENAASSAPFTAGVAPGEFITLYGTGLAPSEQVAGALPFPTTLNGVQVLINSVPAPIYYVSPNQVSVIVPYETTYSIAAIQVKNNGAASNAVTLFVNKTAPGVFSQSQNGLGLAAASHADFSLVTPVNPAQIGETIQVYLTGLGDVVPAVPDGAAGPSSPLSLTTNTISAAVGGQNATVTFAGLAPGFAGLYQVNLVVPSGLTAGDNSLEIAGPDSYTLEAVLPVTDTAALR
jgi:uncharacterized protein (TIGR03437 family)